MFLQAALSLHCWCHHLLVRFSCQCVSRLSASLAEVISIMLLIAALHLIRHFAGCPWLSCSQAEPYRTELCSPSRCMLSSSSAIETYNILSFKTHGALIALHIALAALGTLAAGQAGSERHGRRNSSAVEQALLLKGGSEGQGCSLRRWGPTSPHASATGAKKRKQDPSLSQQQRRKQLHPARSSS
jgi:hypothetical protein